MVVVAVAVLLVVSVSKVFAGAVTVAVLLRVPLAEGGTTPVTVYVIVLPAGMVTVSLMLPPPDDVLPVAPPVALDVNATPVKPAGNVSVTVAPVCVSGPLLLTMIV